MKPASKYFLHRSYSPELSPFSSYLREVGMLKFTGIGPRNNAMHYNEGIEYSYVIKGSYQWEVEGNIYRLLPGEGFVTCPWELHGSPTKIFDRGSLAWIILKPDFFVQHGSLRLGAWSSIKADVQEEIGRILATKGNHVIPKGNRMADTFSGLHREITERRLGYETRVNLLLDSLLIDTTRALQEGTRSDHEDDGFVVRLNESVHKAIDEKMSIDDLAYSFDMSVSTFSRKVKELTGYTPADYILEQRFRRAKALLLSSAKPITGIAIECGFATSQHFATQFRKRIGVSPSRFREMECA